MINGFLVRCRARRWLGLSLYHLGVVNRVLACLTGISLALAVPPVQGQASSLEEGPLARVYKTVGGISLTAYLFFPPPQSSRSKRSAVVLFHGGGWNGGDPDWVFGRAKMFASRGMVAVVAQYRLSDERDVTPIEAMADARDVICWLRHQAKSLDVDPARIAAYGVSAGGHLAAAAAIFHDTAARKGISASPNALILFSPAVSVGQDQWFRRMLGKRAEADEFSPDEHIRSGLPPTIIFQGSNDTVTTVDGAQRFCDRMKQAGNRCDLHIYTGLGHLLQPATSDPNAMAAGAKARADAVSQTDLFLVSLGFLPTIQKSKK